ncbi:queuine tRNA-ribosyltransferase accessory subunit 2 isoform X2 [Clupea harengus]|uniref:Queuine tRNA-ribosyltransferase accessory subunit 2 n=1 Tax=Clupea harengus TaxID=7950 RepID=A0A6P3VHX0_CLUHA|nr:queuine tRNA-ribosyltransferase accessory subunit 2 isoform X2 [Clupea harengus]
MKLEISQVVQGCRLGALTGLGKTAQHSLETPGCLLYTRCGSVPHLTQDTLHTLTSLPAVTQLTLATLAEHQEVLEEFKEGARKFAGLHDTVVYCSLHDPAAPNPPGYITNKTVSVWGSGGRIELTVARYMALQAAIQPDWYQSMADGETGQENTSRKRVRKAVDRTLSHLDECLVLHQKMQELKEVEIFGVVEGGDVREERLRSARETAKRPVTGFVLDGFQSGVMGADLRSQLIAATTAELPQDKPRLLQGVGRPDEVLDCVEAGVDLFESFFPYQATERGCALCFDFNIEPDPERAVLNSDKEEIITGELLRENGDGSGDAPGKMTCFEKDLRDKRYREDFRPLVLGCSCYCCRNHQRAYVHHLLVTNELLAGVLLMLHNTAHYLSFFQALRRALAQDRLPDLKKQVLQCHQGQ